MFFLKPYKMFRFGYILSPRGKVQDMDEEAEMQLVKEMIPLALFFCSLVLVGVEHQLVQKEINYFFHISA